MRCCICDGILHETEECKSYVAWDDIPDETRETIEEYIRVMHFGPAADLKDLCSVVWSMAIHSKR
jgi:hypothetical protein